MTHLLAVNLGPVQDFIVQARRTRDLWYGSHLLSEMSWHAAEAIQRRDGKLIFPCPVDGKLPDNVANKILAEMPGDEASVASTAKEARGAAMGRLRELASKARENARGLLDNERPGFDAVWKEQIETFVEFNAAWVAIEEGTQGYRQAREALERALAGRKALRDFDPWPAQTRGVHRSTLDGVRETLLRPSGRSTETVRRYRLTQASERDAGEELDAIGIARRMGGDPDQFPPITNLALAPWITLAKDTAPQAMEALARFCTQVEMPRFNPRGLTWCTAFPFEAQVLLRERWRTAAEDRGLSEEQRKELEERSGAVLGEMSTPHPYVACLVADGDHMGATLDGLDRIDDHRKLSRALAAFATEARKVVEQDHRGLLVFSGGDDVLAFVTLADALACANKLRELFVRETSDALKDTGVPPPTLSVGLGVGHLMEDMRTLLELGREAEKQAKGSGLPKRDQRDAIAVVVDKRAGARHKWRARWGSQGSMNKAIAALRDTLPNRKVYEIKRALVEMPKPEKLSAGDGQPWARLLCQDIARILKRVEGGSVLDPREVGLEASDKDYALAHRAVSDWVDMMLVARMFAEAVPAARRGGRR